MSHNVPLKNNNDIDISELLGRPDANLTLSMLESMNDCLVVAPEFLSILASSTNTVIRASAAEHINTPPKILEELLKDRSQLVAYAAYDNPCTPFIPVLLKEITITNIQSVQESVTISKRQSDYKNMLKKYSLSHETVKNMPIAWLSSLIK